MKTQRKGCNFLLKKQEGRAVYFKYFVIQVIVQKYFCEEKYCKNLIESESKTSDKICILELRSLRNF
jgi:hypothetical protein